ncbi:MAG: 50S ribosomal protein L9 [Phycisphaerales bacterium]|nr:50S ribosomal protein L9 [Phycisphaerales bacterium]
MVKSKSVELLLVETVESLGIVGDVVKVRTGYARNYLLPRGLATEPNDELIKQLAAKRAEAERKLAEIRAARTAMIEKLEGIEVTLERSTNDQGMLYGSVTQQDIVKALAAMGYGIRDRDVRLSQTIKRIGDYEVVIRPEADLEAAVKLHVKPDRKLELEREAADLDFDDEGNLVRKPKDGAAPAAAPAEGAEAEAAKPAKAPKGDTAAKAEKKPKAAKA